MAWWWWVWRCIHRQWLYARYICGGMVVRVSYGMWRLGVVVFSTDTQTHVCILRYHHPPTLLQTETYPRPLDPPHPHDLMSTRVPFESRYSGGGLQHDQWLALRSMVERQQGPALQEQQGPAPAVPLTPGTTLPSNPPNWPPADPYGAYGGMGGMGPPPQGGDNQRLLEQLTAYGLPPPADGGYGLYR